MTTGRINQVAPLAHCEEVRTACDPDPDRWRRPLGGGADPAATAGSPFETTVSRPRVVAFLSRSAHDGPSGVSAEGSAFVAVWMFVASDARAGRTLRSNTRLRCATAEPRPSRRQKSHEGLGARPGAEGGRPRALRSTGRGRRTNRAPRSLAPSSDGHLLPRSLVYTVGSSGRTRSRLRIRRYGPSSGTRRGNAREPYAPARFVPSDTDCPTH